MILWKKEEKINKFKKKIRKRKSIDFDFQLVAPTFSLFCNQPLLTLTISHRFRYILKFHKNIIEPLEYII